eukprot:753790-Hanusia_phi.AAC.13
MQVTSPYLLQLLLVHKVLVHPRHFPVVSNPRPPRSPRAPADPGRGGGGSSSSMFPRLRAVTDDVCVHRPANSGPDLKLYQRHAGPGTAPTASITPDRGTYDLSLS